MLLKESNVKPEGITSLAEEQSVATKNLQPGSQVSGKRLLISYLYITVDSC